MDSEGLSRPECAGGGGPGEPVGVARRLGYEDGLVAIGIPRLEAARRAAERYPRLPEHSAPGV